MQHHRHNEKLLHMSKKLSQDTLRKSNETVRRLTHLPPGVLKTGYFIGGTIGAGLVCIGIVGLVQGSTVWGVSGVVAGAITVASNIIAMRRNFRSRS